MMTTPSSLPDSMLWTETKSVSGYSVLAFAYVPAEDVTGPWGHTSGGNANWVAVGLRADSGVVDVAAIHGESTHIGMFAPTSVFDKIPRDVARGIGRALNPEMSQKQGALESLGRKMGMISNPEEFGMTIRPIVSEQGRSEALALLSEDRALAFGAMMRAHPKTGALMDGFEGPARVGDVRHPGVVSVINAVNGAQIGEDGRVVRDPDVAAMWQKVAKEAPGVLGMVEKVGEQHHLQTLTAGAPTNPTRAYERLAEAWTGRDLVGDERTRAGLWVRTLGHEAVDSTTRSTMMGALDMLAKRERQDPKVWSDPAASVGDVQAMGAAVRLTRSIDAVAFTSDATETLIRNSSPRAMREVGMHMLAQEQTMGADPLGVVRGAVAKGVVRPATLDALPAGHKPAASLDDQVVAHAQYAIIGTRPLRHVPARIEEVQSALSGTSGRGMGDVLFQEPEDQKLPADRRAVVPAVRRLATRQVEHGA